MKKIVLRLYEFDELSKDSQERIIERERWNVMERCMDAYDIDYKKSMEAFEDLTDTKVYGWEERNNTSLFRVGEKRRRACCYLRKRNWTINRFKEISRSKEVCVFFL